MLLAVVGASARRPLGGGSAAPTVPAWPLFLVAGVGIVGAAAIVAAALWPPPRRRRGHDPVPLVGVPVRPGPLAIAIAVLVPLAVVALLTAPGRREHSGTGSPLRPIPIAQAPRDSTRDHRGGREAAALAAGLALGLLALGLVLARDRRGRGGGVNDDARTTVAAGTRDALAALAIPSDPRAGVLAAYARMQAALEEAGLARRPSEAPREYLDRLTVWLGVARAPATRLTTLFERARFSPHAIDEPMRGTAVAALESIRGSLEEDGR